MYRHGSSARVGVGKRGHGGREYKPPPERRNPNSTPPPLKQCGCLLEFHLTEYQSPAPQGRQHHAFGGRQVVEQMERDVRSNFCVHLILPGRKQSGAVAVVGQTHREAVPAAMYILRLLSESAAGSDLFPIAGRAFLDTKQPTYFVAGQWQRIDLSQIIPQWLFTSQSTNGASSWSALMCPLSISVNDNSNNNNNNNNSNVQLSDPDEGDAINEDVVTQTVTMLKACLDNALFRLGANAVSKLDVFLHERSAFCVGDTTQANIVHDEITKFLELRASSD